MVTPNAGFREQRTYPIYVGDILEKSSKRTKNNILQAADAIAGPARKSLHNPGYLDILCNKTGGGKAFNL